MAVKNVLSLVLCITTSTLSIECQADTYTERPVTLVVAFGPGGSMDRMARTMSTHLGDALGQPVSVINKKGAGTLLLVSLFGRRAADRVSNRART